MRTAIPIAAAAVLLLTGCGGNDDSGTEITSAELGDAWPFDVEGDSVTLRCDRDAITVETDLAVYAVNGTALGRADAEGWLDVEAIWLDDPANPGLKINIGPVIDRGLDLCAD